MRYKDGSYDERREISPDTNLNSAKEAFGEDRNAAASNMLTAGGI
jgi:hypothetical protein